MIHLFKRTLLILLPHHIFSRLIQWSARCRHFPFRQAITRWCIRHYKMNMSEVLEPDLYAYPTFNSFFTRALKPEVRPIVQGKGQISCPADSTISQLGKIKNDLILQAKGHSYSLTKLLGGSEERAQPYMNGQFANMYLSPGNYHRVHMPLSGRLLETVYIPGRLFSVSPEFTESIPQLFALNERLVSIFQTEAGPMAMILVGALFVGGIETVWAGEVTPPRGTRIKARRYDNTGSHVVQLARGEEMGRFNLGGSTIIVLFKMNCVKWQAELCPEMKMQFGQLFGRVLSSEL